MKLSSWLNLSSYFLIGFPELHETRNETSVNLYEFGIDLVISIRDKIYTIDMQAEFYLENRDAVHRHISAFESDIGEEITLHLHPIVPEIHS